MEPGLALAPGPQPPQFQLRRHPGHEPAGGGGHRGQHRHRRQAGSTSRASCVWHPPQGITLRTATYSPTHPLQRSIHPFAVQPQLHNIVSMAKVRFRQFSLTVVKCQSVLCRLTGYSAVHLCLGSHFCYQCFWAGHRWTLTEVF